MDPNDKQRCDASENLNIIQHVSPFNSSVSPRAAPSLNFITMSGVVASLRWLACLAYEFSFRRV
jgi:hypothetical protein